MVRSAATTCRWCRPRLRAAARRRPIRRPRRAADYELALQIGNKDALNAFLAQYPDGFYASLAKLQLDKIAAEETRVAATEKARQAEQERARLAAEGAQKAQQAKAEADAKAAEQARIAAEKAKQVAQEQAAAAERKRVATDTAATDRRRTATVPTTRRPKQLRQDAARGDEPGLAEPRAAAGRADHKIGAEPSCAASAVSPAPPTANGTRPRSVRWRCSTATPEPNSTSSWPASTRSMRSS